MLPEHIKLCMNVMKHLEADELKYPYFQSAAITALSEDEKIRYNKLIDQPRDLNLIKNKLNNNEYNGIPAFKEDVELCFENSKKFCKGVYKDVHQIAVNYQKKFRNYLEKLLANPTNTSSDNQNTTTSNANITTSSNKSKTKAKTNSIQLIDIPFLNYQTKCNKIIKDLLNISITRILNKPVNSIEYPDYSGRIPYPIDFSLILEKINNSNSKNDTLVKYNTLNEFTLDVRRIVSNFIRYNYIVKSANLRKQVVHVLLKFEKLLLDIINDCKIKYGDQFSLNQHIPELSICLEAFEDIIKVPSRTKNVDPLNPRHAIDSFIDPVSVQLSPDEFTTYKNVISNPMDYGTIMSKLIEAKYSNINELFADIRLVSSNCRKYWTKYGGENELEYIEDAEILEETFIQSINEKQKKLNINLSSTNPSPINTQSANLSNNTTSNVINNTSITMSSSTIVVNNPTIKKKKIKEEYDNFIPITTTQSVSQTPVSVNEQIVKEENPKDLSKRSSTYLNKLLHSVIEELKRHYLPGALPGSKIYSATPFLKSVDPIKYPDYAKIVLNPIDLNRIDKRISGNRYNSIESFVDDISLLKDNAYLYNTGVEGLEVRIMSDAIYYYTIYLIKSAMLDLQLSNDDKLITALVSTYVVDNIIHKPDNEIVTKYLDNVEKDTGIRPRFHVSISSSNNPPVELSSNTLSIKSKKKSVESKLEYKFDNQIDKLESKQDIKIEKPIDSADSEIGDDLIIFEDINEPINRISKNKIKGNVKGKNKSKPELVEENQIVIPNENTIEKPVDIVISNPIDIPVVIERPIERQRWELDCESVFNTLIKHPYIDTNNPQVVSNFFISIVESYPNIARDYLNVVKNPMDLLTLKRQLDSLAILDPEDFYDKIVSIFQNAVDYNEFISQSNQLTANTLDFNSTSYILKYKTVRYKHLATYTQWLCLETLSVKDDTSVNSTAASKLGHLRLSIKLAKRKERENIITTYQINRNGNSGGLVECDKLLKALKRTRNNSEKAQLDFFLTPIDASLLADYYGYVRKPMDLTTIKYRLDGSLPYPASSTKPEIVALLKLIQQHKLYTTYWDFICDLRRVFDNAIVYNSAHVLSDTTGLSQRIVDAAIFYKEKLENLIGTFSIKLIDKLERNKIKKDEDAELENRKRNRFEDIEQSVQIFKNKEKEKLLAEDSAFAADLDTNQRHALNRQQEIVNRLSKRKLVEDNWNKMRSTNDIDILEDEEIAEALQNNESNLSLYTQRIIDKRHNHLIAKTQLPIQFVRYIDSKVRIRDLAWKKWEHLSNKSKYTDNKIDSHVVEGIDSNTINETIDKINDKIDNHNQSINFLPIGSWNEITSDVKSKSIKASVQPIILRPRKRIKNIVNFNVDMDIDM